MLSLSFFSDPSVIGVLVSTSFFQGIVRDIVYRGSTEQIQTCLQDDQHVPLVALLSCGTCDCLFIHPSFFHSLFIFSHLLFPPAVSILYSASPVSHSPLLSLLSLILPCYFHSLYSHSCLFGFDSHSVFPCLSQVSGIVFLSTETAERFLSTLAVPPLDGCTYQGLDSGAEPLEVSGWPGLYSWG